MGLPPFDHDMDIIQKLDDEPNDVGGLTAAELKAKFDEPGNVVKQYMNETLIPAVDDAVDHVDQVLEEVKQYTADAIDEWLDEHPEATTTVQDGAVTTAKLASGAVTTDKIAAEAVTTAKLGESAVITANLSNGAVTAVKLADGAVTRAKLASGVTEELDGLDGRLDTVEGQLTSPFNFKGSVADMAALEAVSDPEQNDTYYVEALMQRYSWTGSAWAPSSLDESDYEDELGKLENAIGYAVPFSEYDSHGGNIFSTNVWTGVTSGTYYHKAIPLSGIGTVKVKANSTYDVIVAFLKTYTVPTANSQVPDFSTATGFTGRINIPKNTSQSFAVPSDATYLIVGITWNNIDTTPKAVCLDEYDIVNSIARNVSDVKQSVAQLDGYDLDAIADCLMYDQQIPVSSIEEDTVYNTGATSGVSLSGYNTYTFEVMPNHDYYISAVIPSGVNYRPALYYDANGDYLSAETKDGTTYSDYKITTPAGAASIKVSFSSSSPSPSLVNREIAPFNIPDMIGGGGVSVTANGVMIQMDEYSVVLQKHGYNNLMDMYRIYHGDELIYTGTSDWQGPYVVDAVHNADGDAVAAGRDFTGGNHPYSSVDPGNSTATAETVSFAVCADGKAITAGNSGKWLDSVTVAWENEVQAWNTKKADGSGRSVLVERPVWTFHRDGSITVSNTIIPSEDVLIYNYYGLQMQATWLDNGFFVPSVTREIKTVSDLYTLSGGAASGTEVTGSNDDVSVTMGYDPLSDLGTGAGLVGWNYGRIHMNNTKMYTKMCYNFPLGEGCVAQYRGLYKLKKPGELVVE